LHWHNSGALYEQQILRILLDVGARGISVKKLAKHVYNHFCTFFYQPDLQEIHRFTQQYLLKQARQKKGIIEHAEKRGYYRLNTRNAAAIRKLRQQFSPETEKEETQIDTPAEDRSLSLF
jgi:DNA repair protein RadC